MSIPIEQIVPGVWEVTFHDSPAPFPCIVDDAAGPLMVCFVNWRMLPLSVFVAEGGQFTRRYIPCDGEPTECWAVSLSNGSVWQAHQKLSLAKEHHTNLASIFGGGHAARIVRGVFIPIEEPSDA